MASPLTSAAFTRLLVDNLRQVSEDQYKALPSMIDKFFKRISSDSAWEEFFSIGGVPDIPEFNGKITYLGIAPGYHVKIEPKEFSAGIMAERKLIDDKKYGVLDNRAKGLMKSAHRVQEKRAADVFRNAFSTAFDFQVSEEGVALCSSSHTTKSGTSTTSGFDNSGTSALTKTSVAATRILMRQFRNDISERIAISDQLALVVPDNLADKAAEIVGTQVGLDTAEGNINPQYKRYEVSPYMLLDDTDTNNWFMVDKPAMKDSLLWVDRTKPESQSNIDFATYTIMQAVYMRFACGFIDWRWIYGHQVS